MPVCSDCSQDFDLLKEGDICMKCQQLQGKSAVEKQNIREKGQCKACSVVFAQLDDPLCMRCCNHYNEANSVPRSVLQLGGAMRQLETFTKRDLVSDILSTAAIHQGNASVHRLGVSRPQNASLQKASKSRFTKPGPGISKGKSLLAEMKQAKEDANKIKISTCLWLISTQKNGTDTFVKVPQVSFSSSFDDGKPIWTALGEIVADAAEFHRESRPFENPIVRNIVTFYAHEGPAKAMRLATRITNKGTVLDFLNTFRKENWISKTAFENRTLEIRLACEEIHLLNPSSDNAGHSAAPRSSTHSDVFRGSTSRDLRKSVILSSKRRLSSVDTETRESALRKVRRSAWRQSAPPTTHYSRDLVMVQCHFTRTTAAIDGADVSFTVLNDIETIYIAKDWLKGFEQAVQKESYGQSGFIGRGTAKHVIYARFHGIEYALGQGFDGISAEENRAMLKKEFENMVYGESFREEFEDLAIERGSVLPKFRFNLKGAILGKFLIQEVSDEGVETEASPPCGLTFFDFIATPLLPCGPGDAPIEKFTGNDNPGNAPGKHEQMTMALHAFSHFMILESLHNLILCDLQGLYDKERVMCLIDPQSHSSGESGIYWDRGPSAIEKFLTHHLESCDDNKFCTALNLKNLKVVAANDPEGLNGDLQSTHRSHSVAPRPLRHGFPIS